MLPGTSSPSVRKRPNARSAFRQSLFVSGLSYSRWIVRTMSSAASRSVTESARPPAFSARIVQCLNSFSWRSTPIREKNEGQGVAELQQRLAVGLADLALADLESVPESIVVLTLVGHLFSLYYSGNLEMNLMYDFQSWRQKSSLPEV